jgi:hypothetical protein
MNAKFWISIVVMFVMAMASGFIVHGTWLAPEYAKLPNLMRTMQDTEKYFPYMLLAHALIAIAFTWIYLKGREVGKPWLGQGVRYGIAVALLSSIPFFLIYYAVMPYPSDLVMKQIIGDTVGLVLMGAVLAFINKTA